MSQLDFDSKEFEKRMSIYGAKSEETILRVMTQNALDLEKDANATAPHLWGVIEKDITAYPAERVHGGYEATVWAGTDNSRPYALRQHEELKPDGGMVPGVKTANKPSLPWGPAGGKYLTRPLMFKMNEWSKKIADALGGIK